MRKPSPAVNLLMISITAVSVSLFWRDNALTAAILLAASAVSLFLWHDARNMVRYALAATLGPASEMVCVHFGAWAYASPLYLIPLWLPFAWGLAGMNMVMLSDWITEKRRKP